MSGETFTRVLSPDAWALVCALVHGSEDVDMDAIVAPHEVWAEVREAFPLAGFFRAVEFGGDITYDPES